MTANGQRGGRFRADVLVEDTTVRVVMAGELDLAYADEAAAALRQAEEVEAEALVIDLGPLDFMDSTGLHVLLVAVKRCEDAGRDLTVQCPEAGPLRRLLDLSGVSSMLPVRWTQRVPTDQLGSADADR